MMARRRPPPETCPACGADVPRHAAACPACGADYETGWNEEATRYDGMYLPDQDFDHEDFVRREFGEGAARGTSGRRLWVVAVVAVLVGFFLLRLLRVRSCVP
jgi:hypothetical protein